MDDLPKWSSTTIADYRLGRSDTWSFRFHWRRSDGFMGRFGGGWNWKIGLQMGSSSLIISLLIFSITISKPYKKKLDAN